MSYGNPPSRTGSLFRRLANASQVDSILEENAELRKANAYCKSETVRARMALSVATWETKNLQNEYDELTRQIQEITEAWRTTRQCELAGFERLTQVQRTLEGREKEMDEKEREMVELRSKHDALLDEKETASLPHFILEVDCRVGTLTTEEGSGPGFRMW